MAAEVVQMNIRLNAQTKKQADQLIERAGFTTTQFLRALWDQLARPESDEDTVKVFINRIRSKIKDYPEIDVETIRGIGYKGVRHET